MIISAHNNAIEYMQYFEVLSQLAKPGLSERGETNIYDLKIIVINSNNKIKINSGQF